MEIKWTDVDPESGGRRYVVAKRFGGKWSFKYKLHRREEWTPGLAPTRQMWEEVLDILRRRYVRRDGVHPEDIEEVERILRDLPVPRDIE